MRALRSDQLKQRSQSDQTHKNDSISNWFLLIIIADCRRTCLQSIVRNSITSGTCLAPRSNNYKYDNKTSFFYGVVIKRLTVAPKKIHDWLVPMFAPRRSPIIRLKSFLIAYQFDLRTEFILDVGTERGILNPMSMFEGAEWPLATPWLHYSRCGWRSRQHWCRLKTRRRFSGRVSLFMKGKYFCTLTLKPNPIARNSEIGSYWHSPDELFWEEWSKPPGNSENN